jgi:alkylation response protein AidB-like acyl-CoA dehydrogenase
MMHRFGSDQLKEEALKKVAAGEAICSLGYSEPGSGSDVFSAKTRATPEGNGWRIDGQKMFTSGANIADYVLLLARTDPNVPKHKGLTMFVVPLNTLGVTIQPVYTFQDERTNITFYDGVKISDTYRLGHINDGAATMAYALELEHGSSGYAKTHLHLLRCAEKACRAIQYNGAPLIENGNAQARLAHATANVWVSHCLKYRAMWIEVENKPRLAYGPMTKLFSSEKFYQDAADLLNLTAPHSLSMRDGSLAFINQSYRHSQGTRIYGGTSQIHRSLIAERMLGLPRSRT